MSNRKRTLNRTERLFALVLLLQNKPSMTSRDLAEHFGVTRRTIFRDLRALGESGVPLTYAEEGGYEILAGYQLPPLMFSARQAATLLIGAELMKIQTDADLRAEADSVAQKIRSVLPARIQDFIDRLTNRTVLDPYRLHHGDSESRGNWFRLSEAVAQRRSVMMEYYVQRRDELAMRTIDPLGMVYYTDHWNVIAHDHLRNDYRSFIIDNIRSMMVLGRRFEPPEGFNLREYLKDRGHDLRAERVVICFTEQAYRIARRHIPAEILSVERATGSVTVTFEFENMDFLAHWLLRYGTQAQVLHPPHLCNQMCAEAEKMLCLYSPEQPLREPPVHGKVVQ